MKNKIRPIWHTPRDNNYYYKFHECLEFWDVQMWVFSYFRESAVDAKCPNHITKKRRLNWQVAQVASLV